VRAQVRRRPEETASCVVGNLLSIGLAPAAPTSCAQTVFRNSVLVNAILSARLATVRKYVFSTV